MWRIPALYKLSSLLLLLPLLLLLLLLLYCKMLSLDNATHKFVNSVTVLKSPSWSIHLHELTLAEVNM